MANCLYCGNEFTVGRNTNGKYCSNACQAKLTSKKVVDTWLSEESAHSFYGAGVAARPAIRRFLIEEAGCKCSRCGWGEKHANTKYPALEIEHIDGNWENCTRANVTIICPNCHSLTDTYKARNLGKGRAYRRIK